MMESETEGEGLHLKPKKEVESEAEPSDGNNLQIPDEGWGWVVCLASFMINFISMGIFTSTGIILLGLIELFNNMSKISTVGSIFLGISMCIGPLVLLLMMFNASHRQVIIFAGFFGAVSTFASVFAEKIEILYITYGIFTGGFVGIAYFAGNTILGSYFKKKQTLAVGIANSGGGCGTFVLNYLIERSISFYAMRGTFLLISGLISTFIVFGALCRPLTTIKKKKTEEETVKEEINPGFESDEKKSENKINAHRTRADDSKNSGNFENDSSTSSTKRLARKFRYLRLAIFDPEVLKNSGIQCLLLVYFLWGASEVILLYLPLKVVSVQLSREQGAWIISIYGGVLASSQIVVGFLADLLHIPKSYILTSSLFGMSVTSVAFIFCDSFPLFAGFASIFGICNGFSTTLRVVLVASIVGKENIDKGYSPLCLLIGVAFTIFPIIAGALYDATQSFDATFYFAGACLFLSYISSNGIIYLQRKKKFNE